MWFAAAISVSLMMVSVDSFATQRFVASRADLAASGWQVFDSLEGTHWAQAARAGFGYCEQNGFVAGYLDGTELADTFGAVCFGANQVEVMTPSFAELNDLDFSLADSDIHENSWSMAHRSAQNYCEVQGYRAGFPNGHQYDDHYGMVCVKDTGNEERFAINDELLNSQPAQVAIDLEYTLWNTATRAAQRVCESLGYLGGWLDGHQFLDRKGLICTK
jgi:hypothetical protein